MRRRVRGVSACPETKSDRDELPESGGGATDGRAPVKAAPDARAFWEPTVAAFDYFRAAFRAKLMRDVKEGQSSERAYRGLAEEMDARGRVDALPSGPLREATLGWLQTQLGVEP